MNRVCRSLIILISYICATQVCLAQENCQNSDILLNQKIDIDLPRTTMLFVVNKLAFDFRVPIGLEWASDHRQKVYEKMLVEDNIIKWKTDTLRISSGTLKQVLDSLVSQEPQYRWECSEQTINIIPVESRDKFLKKLLSAKVGNFSSGGRLSKFIVRDMLVEIPEIKAVLKEENVKLIKRDYPNSHYKYSDEIKIRASNTDLRGVLNKIILNNEYKIWIVEKLGDKFLINL